MNEFDVPGVDRHIEGDFDDPLFRSGDAWPTERDVCGYCARGECQVSWPPEVAEAERTLERCRVCGDVKQRRMSKVKQSAA